MSVVNWVRRPLFAVPRAVSLSLQSSRGISISTLDGLKGDRERVVILGSGWGGYTLSQHLKPSKYQTIVISPRSYFVFTPLLASTAVGTLEYRTALESIRRKNSSVEYFQGWADSVDFERKVVRVEENPEAARNVKEAINRHGSQGMTVKPPKGQIFEVPYDKLVVAVGCYSQTFNTKGVREYAYFLKDIGDARRIRQRILECFEKAALPTMSDPLRKQMLHFAIVGGGPTGVEFSAELYDLLQEDLGKMYPDLINKVQITLYDVAPKILPMFDSALAKYAMENFRRRGVDVKTNHHVEEIRRGTLMANDREIGDAFGALLIRTKEEGDRGIGMCVWSTGLMMNPFVERLDLANIPPPSNLAPSDSDLEWKIKKDERSGAIITDDRLQVRVEPPSSDTSHKINGKAPILQDVFAIGDAAVIEDEHLPATAQVANQKAIWLAKRLNNKDLDQKSFSFKNLGILAYIGNWKAIMQGEKTEVKGRAAWLLWRTAYLSMTISLRNKILIPIYWLINWVFGRDISRF